MMSTQHPELNRSESKGHLLFGSASFGSEVLQWPDSQISSCMDAKIDWLTDRLKDGRIDRLFTFYFSISLFISLRLSVSKETLLSICLNMQIVLAKPFKSCKLFFWLQHRIFPPTQCFYPLVRVLFSRSSEMWSIVMLRDVVVVSVSFSCNLCENILCSA